MSQDDDFRFCGALTAYVEQVQNGPIRQKLYRAGWFIFTDAVVFIRPPLKTRIASAGAAVGSYGVGGDAGLHTMAELTNLSAEHQVERINDRISALFVKYPESRRLTSDVVVSEFGDWTDVWPNSKVTHASMKIKGWWLKRLKVTLTPSSGLYVAYDTSVNLAPTVRQALTKAFGSRFVES